MKLLTNNETLKLFELTLKKSGLFYKNEILIKEMESVFNNSLSLNEKKKIL